MSKQPNKPAANNQKEQQQLRFSELLERSIQVNVKPTKKITKVREYLQHIAHHD